MHGPHGYAYLAIILIIYCSQFKWVQPDPNILWFELCIYTYVEFILRRILQELHNVMIQ